MVIETPPPQNQRKRGGRAEIISTSSEERLDIQIAISHSATPVSITPSHSDGSNLEGQLNPSSLQLTPEDALNKIASMEPVSNPNTVIQSDIFCPECYLPLHPDPKPEKLYIFLHAMKYTTSLGAFSTEMPEWAAEGWVWDQS
jgi:tRNA pseudouridine32 synthase